MFSLFSINSSVLATSSFKSPACLTTSSANSTVFASSWSACSETLLSFGIRGSFSSCSNSSYIAANLGKELRPLRSLLGVSL